MSAAQQQCDTCRKTQPLNEEYFNRDLGTVTGYKYTCRTCRSKQRREAAAGGDEMTEAEEQLKELGQAFTSDSINNVANMAIGGGSRVPHVAESYERLIEAFGGPEGYARHFMFNYLMAPEGSSNRTKMLIALMQLGQNVSKTGAADRSLEQYTDEELLDQVKDKLRIAHTKDTA